MKKMLAVAGLVVCSMAAMAGAARAEETAAPAAEPAAEKSWSLDAGFDYASHYIFRGVDLLQEGPALSPHAKYGIGGLSVYYWGYLGDIPGTSDDYHEADFGADYTFGIGKFALTTGAVTYQYNHNAQRQMGFFNTYELYVIGALDVLLTPTFTFYRDMDAVEGGYGSLGISHAFDLSRGLALNLSGAVGFDFGYNLNSAAAAALGVKKSNGGLNDFLAGADLSWQVSESLTVHALVQRSVALDVLDTIGQPDVTVWTLGGTVSF